MGGYKKMRKQSIGADGYTKQAAPGHLQPSVAAPPASWAEGLSILEEGV